MDWIKRKWEIAEMFEDLQVDSLESLSDIQNKVFSRVEELTEEQQADVLEVFNENYFQCSECGWICELGEISDNEEEMMCFRCYEDSDNYVG